MAFIYGPWSNEICATVVAPSSSSRSSASRSSASSRSSSSNLVFCPSPPKCPTGYVLDIIGRDLRNCPIYGTCRCPQCTGDFAETVNLTNDALFVGAYRRNFDSVTNTFFYRTNSVGGCFPIQGPNGTSSSSCISSSINEIRYNITTLRWEMRQIINNIAQPLQYYCNGSPSRFPCATWRYADNDVAVAFTFCYPASSNSSSSSDSPSLIKYSVSASLSFK